jgi:hypothetical protein
MRFSKRAQKYKLLRSEKIINTQLELYLNVKNILNSVFQRAY